MVIYEHLQNIGAITELEFRQIMEVNRNVEVIGITYKENISRELTLLGPAETLPLLLSLSACLQNDKWTGVKVSQGTGCQLLITILTTLYLCVCVAKFQEFLQPQYFVGF